MVTCDAEAMAGLILPPACEAATEMQRIDGSYLYLLGYQIHPLGALNGANETNPTSFIDAIGPLITGENVLDTFLHQSIYKIRFSMKSGETLLAWVKHIKDKLIAAPDLSVLIEENDIYSLKSALATFETNLASEFALMDTYIVSKKGALDTTDLIWNGIAFMPSGLAAKVPGCVADVNEATKCLAYEAFTAVGFHIHRANEAVLRVYYDAVTGGKPRPSHRNIGTYLNALDKHGVGDPRVKTALRDLKDLHRNPLIHPETSLETADEAIDLLSAVRAVVGQMLKEIP